MKALPFILLLLLPFTLQIASGETNSRDSLSFSGQLSTYANYNFVNDIHLWLGTRYIPQLNYSVNTGKKSRIDFEASANLSGNAGLMLFDTSTANGTIKPYRLWARYSTNQFELRLGLQKINFGSASMLRPLMWFDQIDPRDPLQLTDGVWGLLSRYYFMNNANLWLWFLYGNQNMKGWERLPTNRNFPEAGGRFQTPVPGGEAAISYHYRVADSRKNQMFLPSFSEIPEHRLGLDARFDLIAGFWLEGSWIRSARDIGALTNQVYLNLGIDYTLGIGNGVYLACEQLLVSYDQRAFAFENTTTFSLLSASYPVSLFDTVGTIFYYDWTHSKIYSFFSWQKQFDKVVFYLMGYWNPEEYNIPSQETAGNLFAGQGVQLMLVYNH